MPPKNLEWLRRERLRVPAFPEDNAAIRIGDWKLVSAGYKGHWELYNLAADRTELHDLSEQEPDRAKAMLDKWNVWAKRTHVVPVPPGLVGGQQKKAKRQEKKDASSNS